MTTFSKQTVIVTGGAGALGEAVSAAFVAAGSNVVIADRYANVAGQPQESASVVRVEVDVLDESAVAELSNAVVERFGGIDGLVCLAGGFFGDTALLETPPSRLREQLELNLLSAYTVIHAVLPEMLSASGGSIVAVGSRPAVQPVSGTVAYGISKLGVVKLMESIDAEHRKQGIRANAILPSIIDTPNNRKMMPRADFSRWVQPTDIATVVRFLISDESIAISGAAIPVYGRA